MGKVMTSIFAISLVCAAIAGIGLGVYWCIWSLWCWVMPQLWEAGPANLIRPNFWLFAAAWFLLCLIGKATFGQAKGE